MSGMLFLSPQQIFCASGHPSMTSKFIFEYKIQWQTPVSSWGALAGNRCIVKEIFSEHSDWRKSSSPVVLLFSHKVMTNSLTPHGLQHARPSCPSPSPRVCSNSRPSSQWCHLTISSSVVPFSSHLQSFPASRFFPMSRLFASGGASTQPCLVKRKKQNARGWQLREGALRGRHGEIHRRVLWILCPDHSGCTWKYLGGFVWIKTFIEPPAPVTS